MAQEHEATSLRQRAADLTNLVLGAGFVGFGLNDFLLPNKFFDGGITGSALVLQESALHLPVAVWIVLLNIPFVLVSIRLVSLKFAIRTLLCVLLLGVILSVVPVHAITSETILAAIFGGVFLGLGMGMAMRGGAALDGLEVMALYTGRSIAFTTSEIILGFNVVIFLIAAWFIGLENALYSTLTYYAASRTTNFVVEGLEEYTSMTIVSGAAEEIKRALVTELGRGITVYKGERGFLPGQFDVSHSVDIIFTVVTRLEVRRVRHLVHRIDPRAFIVTATAKEAVGGVISRRPSH